MLDNPDTAAMPREATGRHRELLDLLERRRSVAPLRLGAPGPNSEELRRMLGIATRVPDHGALEPWRIILVQGAAREALSERLAAAFVASNTPQDAAAAELAVRKIKAVFASAPLIVIVVSRADPAARVPEWEQILSAGAVCMNLMTAAFAFGYGATWLSGWAAYDPTAMKLLGVQSGEKIAGIIPIGAIMEPPQDRARPSLEKLVTLWEAK